MNLETIRSQLRTLKLQSAAREIEEVLSRHKRAVELSWVSELLEREIDARKQRALDRRIKRAAFPEVTTLESFDWRFNPKIDQTKIQELTGSLRSVRPQEVQLRHGVNFEPGC